MQETIKVWLAGLAIGAITGFAGGAATGLATIGIDPEHFNLGMGLGHVAKIAVASGGIHAAIGIFLYLKQSPLPGVKGLIQ